MNDEKLVEDLKDYWDKAFSDIAKPQHKDLAEFNNAGRAGPSYETIILRTLCGCERKMVIPWFPSRRVFQMRLYPTVYRPTISTDLNAEPLIKNRTFVYDGGLRENPGSRNLRVFTEMPEERD